MKLKTTTLLIAGTLFGAALPAQANNDAMMDLLQVLRDKGTISAQDYNLLTNAAAADKQASDAEKAEILTKVESAPAPTSSASVSLGEDGLEFESADKAFTANIGGRIHSDYAFIDDNYFDRNPGGSEYGNGAKFRRARLGMNGTMFTDWTYELEINYGQDDSTEFTDVTLGYEGFENVAVKLGRHKMPVGLEELTSSNRISAMERTAATNTFAPGRRNGITISTKGDNWTATAGTYMGEGIEGDAWQGKDSDYGYAGRFTFAPIQEKTQLVHLGASYHHVKFEEDFAADALANNNGRLRARPGVHFFNDRPVSIRYENTESADTIGLEAAAIFGPFSVQGEYYTQQLSRKQFKDADVDGWYAQATYTLTGESRGYKNGVMRTISPRNHAGKGGWGAWELVARYDELDVWDSSAAAAGLSGGTNILGTASDTWTLGVNWYVNNNIRFMANYVDANITSDHPTDREGDVQAFMFRGQVAF